MLCLKNKRNFYETINLISYTHFIYIFCYRTEQVQQSNCHHFSSIRKIRNNHKFYSIA